MRVLLVAGSPEPSSPELVARLAGEVDLVCAVDRGAEACRAADVVPDAFCGDADTVSAETLAWVRDAASSASVGDASSSEELVVPAGYERDVPEIRGLTGAIGVRVFPPAKYDTDLSLGFSCARQLAAERGEGLELVVTCASAGRMDHALAVFGVLAANADLAPTLVEDAFTCKVLAPQGQACWELPAEARGRHFSFVALADATVVSERGMRWELDHFKVNALRDRGISNVVEARNATITCHEGVLAAFLIA